MKILVNLCRFIIAITFIFSGFVKLVDPLGSAYKFEEYFGADVLNLEFLIPYALPFSILLIMVELLLGVLLLVGFKPKLTVWGTALMMLVFLFLTWYSAYYNKVTDCGCFGDAIKLDSWATFYKNIFFGALILFLLFHIKHIKPWFGKRATNWIPFITLIGGLFIAYYVLQHLPIIDFRPYAIGKSIPEGMEYVGDVDPPIHDFYLESSDGDDLTDKVLSEAKVMLVVSYNLSKSDKEGFSNIKEVTDNALNNGYKVYALTASSNEEFEKIKSSYKLNFEMLFCDETALKTVIRANPGVLTLKNGVITGKWSWTDADKIKF